MDGMSGITTDQEPLNSSTSREAAIITIESEGKPLKESKAGQKVTKEPKYDPTECKPPGETGPCCYKALPVPFNYTQHLSYWTVHKDATDFWNDYGKKVATKNLFVSIGNLLLAFAIWLIWSVVSVLLLGAYTATCLDDTNEDCFYHFTSWKADMELKEYKSNLWLLPATAGLSGATLRLTNAFMVAPSGGRVVISQTSILLLIPMIMLAAALNNTDVSLQYLIIIALITGAGGGAFASSMSNISFFYPKAKQGLALGLNAGIGNLGVSVMQILIPAVVSYGAFGAAASLNVNGIYIANAAIIWIPFLIIFIVAAWFFMNSLPQHPTAGNTVIALTSFYWLEFMGYFSAGIAAVVLIFTREYMSKPGLDILLAFILWFCAVVITVLGLKYLICCGFLKDAKEKIAGTMKVLSMKHTWIMTYLYVMTFGSFIGFSASFPMLIKILFPQRDPLAYAWLGPFVGSIVRPFGGWLSDKIGGAKVTHWDVVVMIISCIGVGVTVMNAEGKDELFPVFLFLFLVLFITTGIGNGSTFRMVPIIFTNKEHAGPVLGWTSAIAAYGAFVIPIIFKAFIALELAQWAFFIFAIYYSTCLGVNWWYYYRKKAEVPC
eukprot:222666_1